MQLLSVLFNQVLTFSGKTDDLRLCQMLVVMSLYLLYSVTLIKIL